MKFKIFKFVFLLFFSFSSLADKRIKVIYFNLKKPLKLELYPSLASTIDFPCPISKVLAPPSNDINFKTSLSENYELDLWLSKGTSKASSLIVRCKNKVFVLDIVPSKNNHTDYLKIIKAINPPLIDLSGLKLISNKKKKLNKKQLKKTYNFKTMKKIK